MFCEYGQMIWRRGLSTRYAEKLTSKDIRDFLELDLNLKCGRIIKQKLSEREGIRFLIKEPFNFGKPFPLVGSIPIHSMMKNKIIFEAYDFNFVLSSDYIVSDLDKQRWINYMSHKFGKAYDEFMIDYSEPADNFRQ